MSKFIVITFSLVLVACGKAGQTSQALSAGPALTPDAGATSGFRVETRATLATHQWSLGYVYAKPAVKPNGDEYFKYYPLFFVPDECQTFHRTGYRFLDFVSATRVRVGEYSTGVPGVDSEVEFTFDSVSGDYSIPGFPSFTLLTLPADDPYSNGVEDNMAVYGGVCYARAQKLYSDDQF